MKKIPYVLICLVFSIVIAGCSSNNLITFYVANSSKYTPEIELEIFLNDSLFVKETFKYSDVVPNYDFYSLEPNQKIYYLKTVIRSKNLTKTDTINVANDKFVYVEFNEHRIADPSILRGQIYVMRTNEDYKQR